MTSNTETIPEEPSVKTNRSAMLIVFLVIFIDLLGFGIMLPLLPRLGETYLGKLLPGGDESKEAGLVLGLLMCSFSAMQFLLSPFWGRTSDRIGRRPILLVGLAGSVVFYALLGFACELPTEQALLAVILMFVARIGAGVAGATISTANAAIADSTPPEKRKMGMALIGAAFGIGFTFGPLVGFAALRVFPEHTGALGFVAAALSGVALLLGLRILPETRKPGASEGERRIFNLRGFQTALAMPTIGLLILTFFLATFGFAQFETTLSLLNKDNLKLDNDFNFLIFAYVGMVLMIVQGVIYRRLAKRLREETFMVLGILLMGLGVASLGAITWWAGQEAYDRTLLLPSTLASLSLSVMGFAFLTPSVSSLISRRTSADKQGEILGVNQSASALARILGPAVGLPLYKLHPSHLLPYVVGAALILVMLPLIPRIRRGAPIGESVV